MTDITLGSRSAGPVLARVPVDLGTRSYDILIGPHLIAQAGVLIAPLLSRPRVAIVTDETVAGLHLETLQASLEDEGIKHTTITVPSGEASKSFSNLEAVVGELLSAGIERQDSVIALGGGVIGDLAGFAAAILRRGVEFIQIPTTLLAQVDSSVGGKTGINTSHGKNLVGAFHQPRLVLADTDALRTLSDREMRAGYAEVVKYGLIDDKAFFEWLDANGEQVLSRQTKSLVEAVEISCKAKARIVSQDEREKGARALLNLGHTFGHALEAELGYTGALLHGEGVAIGLVLAHAFSADQGLCAEDDVSRVATHLKERGLPTGFDFFSGRSFEAGRLLAHMGQDKKVVDGKLTFILTRGIGHAFVQKTVDPGAVERFLQKTLG